MVQRRRGGNFGLMLLATQVMSFGLENIPPATLALIAGQTAIFLDLLPQFFPSPHNVCISSYLVYHHRDFRRMLLSTFYHAHDMHLYYNMVSLIYKGTLLERKFGTPYFTYLIGVFTALTSATYVGLGVGLSTLLGDESYLTSCAVGFSGVLFAMKVLTTHYTPEGTQYALGFIPIPSKYIFWAELALIQLVTPNASFVGHLAGILVGLLYVKGPLKFLMDAFMPPPQEGSSRPTSFTNFFSSFTSPPGSRHPRFHQGPRQPGYTSGYRYQSPPSSSSSEDYGDYRYQQQYSDQRYQQGPIGFEGVQNQRQTNLYPDLDDLRSRRRDFYHQQ